MNKLMTSALLSGMVFLMPVAGFAQNNPTTTDSGSAPAVTAPAPDVNVNVDSKTTTTAPAPAPAPAAPTSMEVHVDNPAPAAPAAPAVIENSSKETKVVDHQTAPAAVVQTENSDSTMWLIGGGLGLLVVLGLVAMAMSKGDTTTVVDRKVTTVR